MIQTFNASIHLNFTQREFHISLNHHVHVSPAHCRFTLIDDLILVSGVPPIRYTEWIF